MRSSNAVFLSKRLLLQAKPLHFLCILLQKSKIEYMTEVKHRKNLKLFRLLDKTSLTLMKILYYNYYLLVFSTFYIFYLFTSLLCHANCFNLFLFVETGKDKTDKLNRVNSKEKITTSK